MKARFAVGDLVELSLQGRRFIKRKHPEGVVVGVNPMAIKVAWEDNKTPSDWMPYSWFIIRTPRADGLATESELLV